MAETFDVAARLAEGRPAVDNIQALVWACHQLGYQNPDLTSHAAQVRELYGSEDGLDLRALDADCAALGRAAEATQEALVRQDEQLAALSDAWQGGAAGASRVFLRRHADASATAVEAVRAAADALATLRDELWRAVDGKVSAAVAIDGRTQAQRAEWLAAAQTVTNGAGDRAPASELIDQQVKPFVDNDIHGEWLTAMRSARASVADAYDAATTKLTALPDAVFDVPGGLGPSWIPALRDDGDDAVATAPAAASAPAPAAVSAPSATPPMGNQAPVWNPPPAPLPIAPPPMSASLPTAPPLEPAAAAPAAAVPPAPSLGGLPDVGGALSGFGQQLADMLGGLTGSDHGLPDPPNLDESAGLDEPAAPDETDVDEDDDKTEADEQAEVDEPGEAVDVPADDVCEPPSEEAEPVPEGQPPVEPVPTPVPEPPAAAAPLPAPEPLSATGTPCEIAADELPQVGQ